MEYINEENLDDVLKTSYPPWVHRHVKIPEISIYQALVNSAIKYSDRTAIDFMNTKISYRTLKTEVDTIASDLDGIGIKKGDKVAIMLPNIPQYITYFFAVLKLGGIVVQVNPLYTTREIKYEMEDSGCNVIVTMDEFVQKAMPLYPSITGKIIAVRVKDYLPPLISNIYALSNIRKNTKVVPDKNIIISKRPVSVRYTGKTAQINPEQDAALIQYTGGTTGEAKGAVLSHRNLISNAYQVIETLPEAYKEKTTYLSAIPFFHVYGMMTAMLTPIIQGSTIILVPDPRNTKMILSAIEKKKPTAFPGIPAMYHSLINYSNINKYNLKNVKICISGASSLPVELQKQFEKLTGSILVEGYGLSECSPVANVTPLVDEDRAKYRRLGSVGLPAPDTYERIVSLEDGISDMPVGEQGELLIKGPQVMMGYWNRPEENKKVLENGWLHTGDIARIDKDGYVYIVDRKKDLIIAGGYNIYPREVEDVIYENPKVSECAVIGIPDEHRGENVKAVIVKKDSTLTEQEVIDFCRERLAVYKIPRIVEFRDSLPLTLVGKIDKKQLRNEKN
ncbi:long-chain fatty acid--CoA ligase [Ferroplasma sp.]|uniref:long-chain-fatty-acid--CoA ligase n=1 Tax=Ferroplasma sp. TaxID=2591003 RepID=UPI002625DBB2|nr:long-chain fatty acid--CoA ligase [Ferroplasma sp.]